MKTNDYTCSRYFMASYRQPVLFFVLTAALMFYDWGIKVEAAKSKDPLALPSETKRICVSLRVLSQRATKALTEKSALPKQLQDLCGIGYLEGFIVDETGDKDLILVGRKSKKRPCLYLDDLIVNMRNIGKSQSHPFCSLDPYNENMLALEELYRSNQSSQSPEEMEAFFKKLKSTVGPQKVLIGGVPRSSRHAHVMIDADYHMKKVSQGHIELPGITSSVDRLLAEKKASSTGVHRNRHWFHIDANSPTFQEAEGIVWIESCPVIVLTEKQKVTSSGELYDVKEDDPLAIAFTKELSKEFPNLTECVPVYADLENLFRLRSLLLAMKHHLSLAKVGWDFPSFLSEYTYQKESPMMANLPGLANWKKQVEELPNQIIISSVTICGGVGMDMEVVNEAFDDSHNAWLHSFRMEALFKRPSKDELIWEVPAPKILNKHLPIPFPNKYLVLASR
ncbi:MAG: DUF1598 domain-containing protein [Desulfatiglandales bacterium]